MSAQPTKSWHRIFGPWPTVNLKGQLVACAAASSEGLRLGMTAAITAPATKVVSSIPNGNDGDAVRQETKDKVVHLFPGVEISAQVVPSGAPGEQSLDLQYEHVGNSEPLLPLMDGLGQDLLPRRLIGIGSGKLPRQPGRTDGRFGLKRALESGGAGGSGVGVHSDAECNRRLEPSKALLVDSATSPGNDESMDIPRPERYTSFPHWLNAVLQLRDFNGNQTILADRVGVKSQSINQWLHGGAKPSPASLKKLATWGTVDYHTLRALSEGEPIPGSRKARAETILKRHPDVEAIALLIDTIAHDPEGLAMVRSAVQGLVDTRRQLHSTTKRPKQA